MHGTPLVRPDLSGLASPRGRLWVWAALVAITAALRLFRAWQLPAVSPDAVVYLQIAEAWAAGVASPYPGEIHWRLFPSILACFATAGWNLETAGVAFNVTAASLVILPLHGWLRRLAGERFALVGCVLYAVHGKLIEATPDIVREPTFWLAMTSCLYCGERFRSLRHSESVIARVAWMMGALTCGIVATLARWEGLVLLIPLSWWGIEALRRAGCSRSAVIAAAVVVASVAAAPGCLWAVSARATPLAVLSQWIGNWGSDDSVEAKGKPSLASSIPVRQNTQAIWPRVRRTATALRGAFTPLYLALGALAAWKMARSRIRNPAANREGSEFNASAGPVALAALGIFTAMWIHLWYDGQTTSRYALSAVILLLPFLTQGACVVAEIAQRVCVAQGWQKTQINACLVAVLALVAMVGMCDAYWNGPDKLNARREFALELRVRFGAGHTLVGTVDASRLVGYYSGWESHSLMQGSTADDVFRIVDRKRPEVVLLNDRYLCGNVAEQFASRLERLSYRSLETSSLQAYPELKVFVRCSQVSRLPVQTSPLAAK